MRLLLLALIALMATQILFSQSTRVESRITVGCSPGSVTTPQLRGLKLRMTAAEASKALGLPIQDEESSTRVSLRRKENSYEPIEILDGDYEQNEKSVNVGASTFSWIKDLAKSHVKSLDGIRALHLTFYRNKLHKIQIDYATDDDLTWSSAKEFSDILSEKLSLPASAWSGEGSSRNLDCLDFRMFVFVSSIRKLGPTIRLLDSGLEIEERDAARAVYIDNDKKLRDTEYQKKLNFKP